MALLLVTEPSALVIATEKPAPLSLIAAGRVRTTLVAPGMASPFLSHWKLKAGAPSNCSENAAWSSSPNVRPCGCVVMTGGPTVWREST